MKTPRHTLAAALAAERIPDESFGAEASNGQADEGRCGVLVRVSPELRSQLKQIAAKRRTTVQSLLLTAITAVLEDPGTSFKP